MNVGTFLSTANNRICRGHVKLPSVVSRAHEIDNALAPSYTVTEQETEMASVGLLDEDHDEVVQPTTVEVLVNALGAYVVVVLCITHHEIMSHCATISQPWFLTLGE